jgi:hypothetical protein
MDQINSKKLPGYIQEKQRAWKVFAPYKTALENAWPIETKMLNIWKRNGLIAEELGKVINAARGKEIEGSGVIFKG